MKTLNSVKRELSHPAKETFLADGDITYYSNDHNIIIDALNAFRCYDQWPEGRRIFDGLLTNIYFSTQEQIKEKK